MFRVAAAEGSAEASARGDERTGLLPHDLQVVRDGIVGALGSDGFAHLTGDQFGEGLGDDSDGVGSERGHQTRRMREQVVAREDRHTVAPA